MSSKKEIEKVNDFIDETKRQIRRAKQELRTMIDILEDGKLVFWALNLDEQRVIRMWRDQFNILAIPELYYNEVVKLYQELRKTRKFSEKRRLNSEIKQYLVPVPISLAKNNIERPSDIPYPVIKRQYSKETGLD